jgi:hypothetical protein
VAQAPADKPTDFSPRAVSRAVLRETLQKPYVLYPVAVGILGGVAAAVIAPTAVFIGAAALGGVVGLGSWAIDYGIRRDKHAADYLKRMQEALAGRVDQTIEALRAEMGQLKFEPGLTQLAHLKQKYAAFEALLRRKLNPQEMTYSRYLGITEQVFLAGLDNLGRTADTLKGLSVIDAKHIAGRIKHLQNDGIESKAQDAEIATLKERHGLMQAQQERIHQLLAENETAMTRIDHAMAAIAAMDTSASHATMDMESAMQELNQLAVRAQAYSAASGKS